MPRKPLEEPSEKQMELLRYLIKFVTENGYQPSQVEMGQHFGITKNAISDRLRSLEGHHCIAMPDGGEERAIRINFVRWAVTYDRSVIRSIP